MLPNPRSMHREPLKGNFMNSSMRRAITLVLLAGPFSAAALRAQTPAAPPQRRVPARVQSSGNSGTISGIVTDPTGAVVANANLTLSNSISGLSRTTSTDNSGAYTFANLPFNTYRLSATALTLAPETQTVQVQSTVPVALNITLQVASQNTTVEVTATSGDLIETDPVNHTDIDRDLFDKIPLSGNALGQLAGHARVAWHLRRLERHVPRHGRPRLQLVLRRWPAHHRSAVQDLLQPDSAWTRCSRSR